MMNYSVLVPSKNLLSDVMDKLRKRKKTEGHFTVYTNRGKKFMVPLGYLNEPIFIHVLDMAREEFGSTVDGPLRVPCEDEFMDYILRLLRKNPPLDLQQAVASIACACMFNRNTSFNS